MPLYECVFVARQDISAGQVDALADNMELIISDKGGSVARREYWGLRSLAYRMKKNRKGHYVLFNFDAPSEAIQEMERILRLHEDVLRYMTIRLDQLRTEPSPMTHGKGGRERADVRELEGSNEIPDKTDTEASPTVEGISENVVTEDSNASNQEASKEELVKLENEL